MGPLSIQLRAFNFRRLADASQIVNKNVTVEAVSGPSTLSAQLSLVSPPFRAWTVCRD